MDQGNISILVIGTIKKMAKELIIVIFTFFIILIAFIQDLSNKEK